MIKIFKQGQFSILLAGGALSAYIVTLLVVSFYSYSARNESALDQLTIDAEKRAEALSYFFSERKDDITTLIMAPALGNFFTNKDLGMSMEYGLKASLTAINNLFLTTVAHKKIKNDDIYRWITLLDQDGNVLASTMDKPQLSPILRADVKRWLDPDITTPTIQTAGSDGQVTILTTIAVYHKDRYKGQLLAELNFPATVMYFIEASSGSSAKQMCIAATERCIHQGSIDNDLINASLEAFIVGANSVQTIKIYTTVADLLNEMVLVNTAIYGTPFSLITLIPTSEVFGPITPTQLIVAMALLAALILYGVLVGMRINTENLVLHARFEESEKQQKTLASRNTQLQQEILKRQEGERLLAHLAHHDTLTDLPNQLRLQQHLKQALQQAHRHGHQVAVLFIDLDRFKNVNDTLGHPVGDELLRATAARLTTVLRNEDLIARLGGDEFIVILERLGIAQDAGLVAEKLLDALSQPFTIHSREVFLTASIGISLYPSHGQDVTEMIMNADAAMYRAKALGRNNFQFYSTELTAAALQRFSLENSLRRALEREELMVYYQPQFSFRTGQITGVEALLRWEHPELGFMLPDRFIPLAEESGLIESIGEWVLREACRQSKRWQSLAFPPLHMAVNLSSKQIMNPRLTHTIISCLEETGVAPSSIELELTESSLMHDPQRAINVLGELYALGIGIVLDDFGTGYSSMNYLKRFSLSKLKIDRSFIQDIPHSRQDAAITKAIIALGHGIPLTVNSEGVESMEQLTFLEAWGCDEWQGNLFSKPVPAAELEELLGDVNMPTTADNNVGNVIRFRRHQTASASTHA